MSYELNAMIRQLPDTVRDRIQINIIQAPEPIQALVAASETVDLTIARTSRAWGIERQTLGRYTVALAMQCRSSLLITRCYSQLTSYLTSLLPETHQAPTISS